jgi:hypothetical protein
LATTFFAALSWDRLRAFAGELGLPNVTGEGVDRFQLQPHLDPCSEFYDLAAGMKK